MVKTSVLKTFSYIFNILIFLCGAAILGLGIWAVIRREDIGSLLNDVTYVGIYMIIITGALSMLFAFLGIFSTSNDSKLAIILFCAFMLTVIALKTIGCIILFVFYQNSSEVLRSTYETGYRPANGTFITPIWDATQIDGKCCGLQRHLDWKSSDYYKETGKYPTSCCVRHLNETIVDELRCTQGQSGFIYLSGCRYVLEKYYYAVGATTIVVIIIDLVAVVLLARLYQEL